MKSHDISFVILLFVLAVSIVLQIDSADTNTRLRGELATTKAQLQWTRGDLEACRGDLR